MHGADHAFQLAADQLHLAAAVLTLLADDQQPDVALQFTQAFHQVAVAMAQCRFHTRLDGALPGCVEHHASLFEGQLVAFLVQRGEFLQEEFAAAQTDDAAEVAGQRVALLIEHVQQAQRRAQALTGPDRAIADGSRLR